MKKYTFGYDLDNIIEVKEYVKKNYNKEDYNIINGYGEDVMNCLKINIKDEDNELIDLIEGCDGEGDFEE